MLPTQAEIFSDDEQRKLAPYFTNSDKHVFALTNLPETVKGALFARYSRTAKSLRRLFLDEFAGEMPATAALISSVGTSRAEKLYDRVFNEYGDDSVAQLGG
ncbi:MAG: thymidylate synthase, partial [Acidobacteriota bacterium]|nr:thymidylate synthase [Acidobacteriota bacterium]